MRTNNLINRTTLLIIAIVLVIAAASRFVISSQTRSTPQSVANSETAPVNATTEDQAAEPAANGSENNLVVKVDLSSLGSASSSNTDETSERESTRIEIMKDGVSVPVNNGEAVPLGDDLQIEVFVSPYPPNSFNADVDFYLTTTDGEPVTDATFDLEYDMLYMFHGAAEAPFNNLGNGHYLTSLYFLMYGSWTLDTVIEVPNHDDRLTLPMVLYVWPTEQDG
ncbi:MAG: hypothetical protein CUN54_00775 [Phototrophicales bacterium]|nr:MAG: hypothetical protein CUN54_00775 [Phototrophicales bacterium]